MHKNRLLPLESYQNKLRNNVNKIALLLNKKDGSGAVIFKPSIKSMWAAEFMEGYFKVRQAKLLNHFSKYRTNMLTLTYSTSLYSALDVATRHKADFKRFVRLMRQIYPKFEYCYFIEITKRFYVHFHVYVDQFYPIETIRETWERITGSYIVDIREIKTEKQKYYCSNYHSVAKKFNFEQLKFAFAHISRFFGQSRHFFDRAEKVESCFNYLGRLMTSGIDFREYFGILNRNETLLINLDELLEDTADVVFNIILMQNGNYRLHGVNLSEIKAPPF